MMNSAKSIETLYQVIKKLMGPIEAKNAVSDVVFNAISELQENGLSVTAEVLDDLLSKKASDYLDASSNQDPLNRDLSDLFDQSEWKEMNFKLKPKNKTVTLRMSEDLLEAIKVKAEMEGLDYQKWIRNSIEESLKRSA